MVLTVDEVFTIAERVEENAADFYTKAADLQSAPEDVEFLRRLAAMERGHRNGLAAMRKSLTDEMCRRPEESPYPNATLYLTTMADAHGGEGVLSQADPLTASDTLEELVKKGIAFEERTILFYLMLKDWLPNDLGRDQIDRIIKEEKQHLLDLTAKLAGLKARSSEA
jgi:rubrerythrin